MKSDWVWIAPTFAIAPFSSVGIERKVSHAEICRSLPNVRPTTTNHSVGRRDRSHAFLYAARLSRVVLREDDLQPVSPQHQNVSPFRAEETTKA